MFLPTNFPEQPYFLFLTFASFAPQGHLSLRSGTFFADDG